MSIIFDGKKFAQEKELQLIKQTKWLKTRGIVPKLATFVDLDNPAAEAYTRLKKKAAEKIGAEVEVYRINKLRGQAPLIQSIKLLNLDPSIHGIMVQLPLPPSWRKSTDLILSNISKKKDVDGLRIDSPFLSATIRSIKSIMDTAAIDKKDSIVVIGSKGEIGKRLLKFLSIKGYSAVGFDKGVKTLENITSKADVLISTTGQSGLIKPNFVKSEAVIIDVGYPKGDVNFKLVAAKTRFITPVPGGVGPVTVVSLLENLVEAATNLAK